MKITLVGGNGFIGSHIVERFIKDKRYDITIFGRSKNPFFLPLPGVEYIYGDFENINLLRKSIRGADIVVHLLSTTVPFTADMDPANDVKNNLIGTIHLLEEVVKQKIKRFIYVSSGGTVYGNPTYIPMDELHPLKPINSYGITKASIENYVRLYAKRYHFSYMIIRPSNPFGPRQCFKGMQGVISTFIHKVLIDEEVVIWGDGTAIRDYIYIDDLIDFFITAIDSDEVGTYNVGAGKGYSVNDILASIEKIVDKKANVTYKTILDASVQEVILDINKAKKVFDWNPLVNLEVGITQHYKWIKEITLM